MQVQLIGVIIFSLAIALSFFNINYFYITFITSMVLGSASAVNIGSSTIQPAHSLMMLILAVNFFRRRLIISMIRSISFPQPGFWLTSAVAYGILGAVFFPRLFEGYFDIVYVGVSANADAGSLAPLTISPISPVSGNITQSIYLIGDIICFSIIVSKIEYDDSVRLISFSVMLYCTMDIVMAIVDMITYATHTEWIMDIVRNSQYGIQTDNELANMKRIAGSFTEASAFSSATLGIFGFTATLWICGIYTVWSGVIALSSILLLVLSTSSTGLIGSPLVLTLVYFESIRRYGFHIRNFNSRLSVLFTPLLLILAYIYIGLHPNLSSIIYEYVNQLVLNKSTTASGIERSSWNSTALNAFVLSYGIGIGLGTARASSFVIAILSNLGILGCAFFSAFLFSSFIYIRGLKWSYERDVRLAARNGAVGILLAETISGTLVDLGLMFFVFSAMACSMTPSNNPMSDPMPKQNKKSNCSSRLKGVRSAGLGGRGVQRSGLMRSMRRSEVAPD